MSKELREKVEAVTRKHTNSYAEVDDIDALDGDLMDLINAEKREVLDRIGGVNMPGKYGTFETASYNVAKEISKIRKELEGK